MAVALQVGITFMLLPGWVLGILLVVVLLYLLAFVTLGLGHVVALEASEQARERDDLDRALRAARRAVRLAELGVAMAGDLIRGDLASALVELAWVERARDELEAAERHLDEAVRVATEGMGADHPGLAFFHAARGWFLHDARRDEEAEQSLRRGLDLFGPVVPLDDGIYLWTIETLVDCLAMQGRDEQASHWRAVARRLQRRRGDEVQEEQL